MAHISFNWWEHDADLDQAARDLIAGNPQGFTLRLDEDTSHEMVRRLRRIVIKEAKQAGRVIRTTVHHLPYLEMIVFLMNPGDPVPRAYDRSRAQRRVTVVLPKPRVEDVAG